MTNPPKTNPAPAPESVLKNDGNVGNSQQFNLNPNRKKTLLIIFGVVLTFFIFLPLAAKIIKNPIKNIGNRENKNPEKPQTLGKFKNEEEFKKYLTEGSKLSDSFSGMGNMELLSLDIPTPGSINIGPGGQFGALGNPSMARESAQRVSSTNVQVKGIDEPDILKTDGKNVYYSSQSFYRSMPQPLLIEDQDRPGTTLPGRDFLQPQTKIIEAFPPENLKGVASIASTGNLLFYNNVLLIVSSQKVVAYNVSIPQSPTLVWQMDLKDNNNLVSGRLMGNFLYLITSTQVSNHTPCNIPVIGGTREISIVCTDIYHPPIQTDSNSTYTVFKVGVETGEVAGKSSVLGTSGGSVVYMSPNGVYVTYSVAEGLVNITIDFMTNEAKDLLPAPLVERFAKVKNLEIGREAKMIELQTILQEYENSLTKDERTKLQNDLQNKMQDYIKLRSRDITQTGVAKIDVNTFTATTSPLVPGTLLNQFSMDEWNGNLRMATTVGGGMFGNENSANDVYVLDGSLNIIGKVTDLGLTERIYSVRFIEDKGYIVTFRQIDPFYVIDLSDPKNPRRAGELKIPGYSGYLHPINRNKILGVGMEGNNVKISLFNVENPGNPLETSKYNLDEFYSEAVSNHHAFLEDKENSLFFMPGAKGGYIFSYESDTISLKRVVTDIVPKRALYINDYLYIAGDDKIIVINLKDFQEVNRLTY